MILPRLMIPKPFDLWRVEAAILSVRRPTVPQLKIRKSANERTKIGKQAAWAKRAKLLAERMA